MIFLSALDVLAVDQRIAEQAAQYYKAFRKKGISLSLADALIAATAKTGSLVLVSRNAGHFPLTDIRRRSL